MKRVVVTGGFQLLHYGHINILQEARKLGEVTVLLNSDKAIKATKGYLAETFDVRSQNLIATGLVGHVLEIGEDPSVWLLMIQPDYQVCGSDHNIEEVMAKGGEYVGKIVILPYTEGVCSTDLYKKEKNGDNTKSDRCNPNNEEGLSQSKS